MRELQVDFGEPHQTPVWLLALAVVVSVGALGWYLRQSWFLQSELRSIKAEIVVLNAQLEQAREKQTAAVDAREKASQTPEARSLAKLKAFPLDQVLAAVETSKTDGVRLTALEISASDGVVRVECDYDTGESAFRYLERLNSSAGRNWALTSLKSKADGSDGGSASVVAKW